MFPFNFSWFGEYQSGVSISPNGGLHFYDNPPCCFVAKVVATLLLLTYPQSYLSEVSFGLDLE
jgi:hypothetical protein